MSEPSAAPTDIQLTRRRGPTRRPWATVAAEQAGVISRRQLLATGMTERSADMLVRTGALLIVWRGVYRVNGAPHTRASALWLAVLATDGVLAYHSAGAEWGIVDVPPSVIEVIVAPGRNVWRPPDVVARRVRRSTTPVERVNGFPVTGRAETVVDLISDLSPGRARLLLDRALQRQWVSAADLDARLRGQPGRHGNQQVRALLAALRPGAESESERRLHGLLRSAGLTGWVANPSLRIGSATYRPDVLFEAARLIVELDGMAHHSDPSRFQHDRRRQNALVAAGFRVVRFTWDDLIDRPWYVVSTIREQLRVS